MIYRISYGMKCSAGWHRFCSAGCLAARRSFLCEVCLFSARLCGFPPTALSLCVSAAMMATCALPLSQSLLGYRLHPHPPPPRDPQHDKQVQRTDETGLDMCANNVNVNLFQYIFQADGVAVCSFRPSGTHKPRSACV